VRMENNYHAFGVNRVHKVGALGAKTREPLIMEH